MPLNIVPYAYCACVAWFNGLGEQGDICPVNYVHFLGQSFVFLNKCFRTAVQSSKSLNSEFF